LVFKKGLAISPLHARQLVVHGHIVIGDRSITIPGYLVQTNEEGSIKVVGLKPPGAPAAPGPAAPEQKAEPQAVPQG
jgi:ribosomal protein S4